MRAALLSKLNNNNNCGCGFVKNVFCWNFYIRKQNSLWAEGDISREKMLNERENGNTAVTRILSGVDDITINGSNKNRTSKKEEMDLVSFVIMPLARCHFLITKEHFSYPCVSLFHSITMKRREMVSHRVINCEPWRARGRPGRLQAHYRKYLGWNEQRLSLSVPRIITHTQ